MKLTPFRLHHMAIGTTLSLTGALLLQTPLPAQQVVTVTSQTLHLSLPTPPQDPGAPAGRRKGGASRGGQCQKRAKTSAQSCPSGPTLTALVTATKTPKHKEFVWGLTTKTHPTFWFVIPQTEATPVEFILQDDQDGYIHRQRLTLSDQTSPGVIQFGIPESATALEIGKRYTWTLEIEATKRHPKLFVKGNIYRVAIDETLQKSVLKATELEKAEIYAKHGLWHDALTTVGKLRQANFQDAQLKNAWTYLMQQIELEEVANHPLLACCTTNSLQATLQPSPAK